MGRASGPQSEETAAGPVAPSPLHPRHGRPSSEAGEHGGRALEHTAIHNL